MSEITSTIDKEHEAVPRNDNDSAQQSKKHRPEQGELLYTIGAVTERTGIAADVIRKGIRQGLFDEPGVRVEGRQGYLFTPGEADEITRKYRLLGGFSNAYRWVLQHGTRLGRPKDAVQLLCMLNGTAFNPDSPSMRGKNVERIAAYYGVSLPEGRLKVRWVQANSYHRTHGPMDWVPYIYIQNY